MQGRPQPRLGWVAWPDLDALVYCTRRYDDQLQPLGVPGPCYRQPAGEAATRVHWGTLSRPDASPLGDAPDRRCRVELERGQLVPEARPVRVFWVTPTERLLVDEWLPDPKLEADDFTTELSFSPETRWMGVLHVVVKLGHEGRIVSIGGAEIRAIPACR
jgi:hypothetical protein